MTLRQPQAEKCASDVDEVEPPLDLGNVASNVIDLDADWGEVAGHRRIMLLERREADAVAFLLAPKVAELGVKTLQ
ncbi:MAG TPA: hypothetical protein VGX37_09325 [Allosphingosinicella sp.]|nr:hypothetical protein [Allosphingosinicella sp.]